jgi:methionine synthase II (cobalamin-independent)
VAERGRRYADPFVLFADGVDIVRSEALELAALGCSDIQVDAPEVATLVDPRACEWYGRQRQHGP